MRKQYVIEYDDITMQFIIPNYEGSGFSTEEINIWYITPESIPLQEFTGNPEISLIENTDDIATLYKAGMSVDEIKRFS